MASSKIRLVLDDSPTKRYGRKIEGAGYHHNPTPGRTDAKNLFRTFVGGRGVGRDATGNNVINRFWQCIEPFNLLFPFLIAIGRLRYYFARTGGGLSKFML